MNRAWKLNHMNEALFAMDQARAAADYARIRYRYYRQAQDRIAYRSEILLAWRMRQIARRVQRELFAAA